LRLRPSIFGTNIDLGLPGIGDTNLLLLENRHNEPELLHQSLQQVVLAGVQNRIGRNGLHPLLNRLLPSLKDTENIVRAERISSFTRRFFSSEYKYFVTSANYPTARRSPTWFLFADGVCRRMRLSVLATPIPEPPAA
jgi:hypothetical protein